MASREKEQKSIKWESIQEMDPEDRTAYLESLGISLDKVEGVPEGVLAGESVAEQPQEAPKPLESETVERKISVPKNSKLHLTVNFNFLNNIPGWKSDFPGGTEEFEANLLNQDLEKHGRAKEIFDGVGFGSLEEAIAPMSEAEVKGLVNDWIDGAAASGNNTLKRKFIDYLKKLEAEGLAEPPPSRKSAAAESSAELKLSGEPVFTFGKGFIKGIFKIENSKYKKDREQGLSVSVPIPNLAELDLEAQKPNIQKAFVEMLKANNYSAKPSINFEADGSAVSFGYGPVIGVSVKTERIEQALTAASKLPGGFKEVSLSRYKEARKYKAEHPNFVGAKEDVRSQIQQAEKDIQAFEKFLLKLPATGPADKRSVGAFVPGSVLDRLWRLQAGEPAIAALRLKAEEKRKGKSSAALPKDGLKTEPVKTETKEAPKVETEKKDTKDKDRWIEPLPWHEPEFKKNAESFWAEVEKDFKGNWGEFLAHKSGRKKKFGEDAVDKYGKKFKLTFPTALRLSAFRIFDEKEHRTQREEFEKLLHMPKPEVVSTLKKFLDEEDLPADSDIRGNWLKAYLISELKKRGNQKTENAEEVRDGAPKEDAAQTTEDDVLTEEEDTEHAQQEPVDAEEVDAEEADIIEEAEGEDAEAIDPLEIINGILENRQKLTVEILTEETGLEGEALDEFLKQYLEEMGYLKYYLESLEEYEVESSTEYLVNAANAYRKLYDKKQAKKESLKVKDGAVLETEDGDENSEEAGFKDTENTADEVDGKQESQAPNGFEVIKRVKGKEGQVTVLKSGLDGISFISIIKDKKELLVPLPENFKLEDEEALKVAVTALENLAAELKGDYAPKIKVSGELDAAPDLAISIEIAIGAGVVKIKDKEFTDRESLADGIQNKDEQSPLFKLLLLERLSKLTKKPEKELTEDDKKQIKLTTQVIARLADSPRKNVLSFTQAAAGEALKLQIAKLKPKAQEKKAA